MKFASTVGLHGDLGARLIRAPRASRSWKFRNFPNVWWGKWRAGVARMMGINHMKGSLYLRHLKANGEEVNYGLVSTKLVTTAFVEYMVDNLVAEVTAWGDFKFHDCGTGVTAAAVGNTTMETQYGGARDSGSQVDVAEIYRSVGTISFTSTLAITEHGLFNIVTAGILMDRHVFAAINVENGDSIEFTYELTCDDGG